MKKYKVGRTAEGKIFTQKYVASNNEYKKCVYVGSRSASKDIKTVISNIFNEYDEFISATDNSKPVFYDTRVVIFGNDGHCGKEIYSMGIRQHVSNLISILYTFGVMENGELIKDSKNLDVKICIIRYDDSTDIMDVTVLTLLELYKTMSKKRKMNIMINTADRFRTIKVNFSMLNSIGITKSVSEKDCKDADAIGINPYSLTL